MNNNEKLKDIKKELDAYLGADWLNDIKDNIKYIKQFKDEQEKVGSTLSTIAENLPKNLVILNVKEELKKYFEDLVKEFGTSIKEFKSSDKQKDIVNSLKDLQKILKENKNKEELKDIVNEIEDEIKGIKELNKLLTEIKNKDNTVKVENMPDFNTKELEETILNTNLDIKQAIEDQVNKVQPVKVENDSIKQAIPVKLVSTEDRYYTAKSGGGGASGSPFVDSNGDVQNALVDTDKHLQVDVLSGGGGGSQYAEDTAHTSGDLGTGALGVRKDTAASLCGTDGDYTLPIFDANGRQHVLDKNSDDINGKITKCDTDTVTVTTMPTTTVQATNLDIRDLTSVSDSVEVIQNTAADLNCTEANSGDIKTSLQVMDDWDDSDQCKVKTYSERQTFVKKTVDATASQTAQTIWDPTAGKKFVITSIVVTCTTAGIITLFDETNDTTNRISKLDMSANSSGNITFPDVHCVSSTADNILKYTTGTFVGSVTCFGYEI